MFLNLVEPIFYLKGAIFDVCLKSYWNKHVEFYVHESEMEKSGIWATDATASLLGFDIIVYAKVGDGLDWVRYFDNALLSDRDLYIHNLNYDFDAVLTVW